MMMTLGPNALFKGSKVKIAATDPLEFEVLESNNPANNPVAAAKGSRHPLSEADFKRFELAA